MGYEDPYNALRPEIQISGIFPRQNRLTTLSASHAWWVRFGIDCHQYAHVRFELRAILSGRVDAQHALWGPAREMVFGPVNCATVNASANRASGSKPWLQLILFCSFFFLQKLPNIKIFHFLTLSLPEVFLTLSGPGCPLPLLTSSPIRSHAMPGSSTARHGTAHRTSISPPLPPPPLAGSGKEQGAKREARRARACHVGYTSSRSYNRDRSRSTAELAPPARPARLAPQAGGSALGRIEHPDEVARSPSRDRHGRQTDGELYRPPEDIEGRPGAAGGSRGQPGAAGMQRALKRVDASALRHSRAKKIDTLHRCRAVCLPQPAYHATSRTSRLRWQTFALQAEADGIWAKTRKGKASVDCSGVGPTSKHGGR